MNLRRTFAISRRIASQFRRDHRTLALMFVAPLVILGLLGWVIRDQTPPETRLAVVNEAGPPGERFKLGIESAAADGGLDVDTSIADEEAGRGALRDGELDLVLVLPDDLLAGAAAGSPSIRVITAGLNPSDDAGRIGRLQGILVPALAGGPVPVIEGETIFGSPDNDQLDAFAPALVGFFAYFLVFILTGISFLRERIGGTLERLLATPIRRSEIVTGYSVGFGFFATLQVLVIMAFALGTIVVPAIGPVPSFSFGLGIANAGSPVLAFVVALLLALGAVNLGIFLSTFARTEFQVLQFIPIVITPQALLCGLLWPITSLPDLLEPVARVLPLTYAIDALREVLVKGSDLTNSALLLDLGVLAGIVVLLAGLATATIRREVA
ncbi:MAG TPA: ABC transporter permease [Clostridia bacterium]|nr:ABC transporter permease [Clostridia bacterium]